MLLPLLPSPLIYIYIYIYTHIPKLSVIPSLSLLFLSLPLLAVAETEIIDQMELFKMVFLAFVFSLLVAKLVSLAMNGEENGCDLELKPSSIVRNETVVQDVKFDKALKVKGTKIKKKVQFSVDQLVSQVEEFETNLSDDCLERFAEKSCDGTASQIEEVVNSVDDSKQVGSSVKEMAVEEILGFPSEESKGENMESQFDALVAEQMSAEENTVNTCVDSLGKYQIGVKLVSDDIIDDQSEQVRIMEIGEDEIQGSGTEIEPNEWEKEKEGLIFDEDDDWEGIERSELEKVFATAADYLKDDNLQNLGSDIQMELYGLHKVAMEGPCHESQPMALKVSARAKWNAWQRLGNMSPEMAMEQYIRLLSDKVPGWSQGDFSAGGDSKLDSSEAANPGLPDPCITSFPDTFKKERKVEPKPCFDDGLTGTSNSVHQDKE